MEPRNNVTNLPDGPRVEPGSYIGVDDRPPALQFSQIALRDFQIRLKSLHRSLREAVARQTMLARQAGGDEAARLCVTPAETESLLLEVDALSASGVVVGTLAEPTDSERREREALRSAALDLGHRLPLDRLQQELALRQFEIDVLVLCAAAEMDRSYGRLFGYVLDDMNRQAPCIELFCILRNPGLQERLTRRTLLGAVGRLRRSGLVSATEDWARPVRTQIALADGVLERLTNPGTWRDRFFDPCLTDNHEPASLECFEQKEVLGRLAAALVDGTVAVGAIWGERASGVDDAVLAVAAAAELPLLKLPLERERMNAELAAAGTYGAIICIGTDVLADPQAAPPDIADMLIDRLRRVAVPICLSGTVPWRPTELLAARDYAEVRLKTASGALRERMWQRELDTHNAGRARDAATRFRLSPKEVRAASRVAMTHARLTNDTRAPDHLDAACRQVTQWQGLRFARTVEPRRGPDDLVLAADLHRQVLEVARFYRSLLQVDEVWGFGHPDSGGVKVLFTGDSGTGKTLAAEVIAGELGLDLLKIDLSRIVSKWVGETEKNLEIAFREAEASNTLLFFDEADTLFGKRGEIRGGNDRYANLEVGFLLQRLEQYSGLAVLASNLRDEIDPAFIRRFHIALHFPRPKEPERRALWRVAFPPAAPVAGDFDLESIVKLDMTGASIVGAARTAAMLAADEGSERITATHIQEGIRRQYRQESRVLGANAFGAAARSTARRR